MYIEDFPIFSSQHSSVNLPSIVASYFTNPIRDKFYPCLNYAILNLPQTLTCVTGSCGKVVVMRTLPFRHGDPFEST